MLEDGELVKLKNFKTMDEKLELLLRKQCECAGLKFEDIDFASSDWFHVNEWTSEQKEEFKLWVLKYLRESISNRRGLMKVPQLRAKKHLEKWFNEWDMMYGFADIEINEEIDEAV